MAESKLEYSCKTRKWSVLVNLFFRRVMPPLEMFLRLSFANFPSAFLRGLFTSQHRERPNFCYPCFTCPCYPLSTGVLPTGARSNSSHDPNCPGSFLDSLCSPCHPHTLFLEYASSTPALRRITFQATNDALLESRSSLYYTSASREPC